MESRLPSAIFERGSACQGVRARGVFGTPVLCDKQRGQALDEPSLVLGLVRAHITDSFRSHAAPRVPHGPGRH